MICNILFNSKPAKVESNFTNVSFNMQVPKNL